MTPNTARRGDKSPPHTLTHCAGTNAAYGKQTLHRVQCPLLPAMLPDGGGYTLGRNIAPSEGKHSPESIPPSEGYTLPRDNCCLGKESLPQGTMLPPEGQPSHTMPTHHKTRQATRPFGLGSQALDHNVNVG
jgi:hypothetical protein